MIWYPYAQMKTLDAPIKISHAKGVHLYTEDGHDLIDSVSSWWSVIHGYNHPEINAAISGQLEKFAHVMLGGMTHEPVRKLSDKLAQWLPGDLDYCFWGSGLLLFLRLRQCCCGSRTENGIAVQHKPGL